METAFKGSQKEGTRCLPLFHTNYIFSSTSVALLEGWWMDLISRQSTCKRCGSENLYTRIEPPHIALRCRDCGTWQCWVSKSRAKEIGGSEKPIERAEAQPQLMPQCEQLMGG